MTVGDNQKSIRDLQRAKGVRDIAPEEKIVMQQITDTMRVVFENYGYSPLETPILERSELYDVKFGQGENTDSIQESFRLTDKADRKLILRNELTAPLAIFVASNPNLRLPFKRYEIGKNFRNGPIKAGRFREFWQCDVDVVGVESIEADVEMIQIALDVYKKLEIPVNIQFNTRKLLNEILDYIGVEDQKTAKEIFVVLDKYDKLSRKDFETELNKLIEDSQTDKLLKLLASKDIEKDLPKSEGIKDVKRVLELVGDSQDIMFNPSLVRGQGYYTGPIFEVYAKDTSKISSSLGGGGRYDEMIGGYVDNNKNYPATGISFGLSTIYAYLENKIKDPQKTVTKVFVIPMGDKAKDKAREVLKELRQNNINSDIDMLGKNMKKNLDYVDSMGIPFAIIIGEDEVEGNSVMLKDMESGGQEKVIAGELVKVLKEKLELRIKN